MTNHDDEKETELDFSEHWSSFNIQQEVYRGARLRQEKIVTNKTEYTDVDLNFPSCSDSSLRARANFPTLRRRKRRVRKAPKKLRKLLKRKTKDRQCPLRIIELAEPRKIQCLNAWKNSGHILPDYMIERLRNHIMDETPIVKISDAVHYFKKRRAISKTSKPKLGSKKYHKVKHILMLSAIFGYRILQILKKPLNIMLSKELDRVNYVIRDEIKSILRTKNKCKDINKSDKILAEISKKVTIWIANILEEASYKQLLEQLNELEEKEGPVLDIIDEIVDNVKIFISSSSSSSTTFSEGNNCVTQSLSSIDDKDLLDISKEAKEIQNTDLVISTHTDNRESESNDKIDSVDQLSAINDTNDMKDHIKNMLDEKFNYLVDKIHSELDNTRLTENNIKEWFTKEENQPLDDRSGNDQASPTLGNGVLDENKNLDAVENNDEITQNNNLETAWGKTNLRSSIEYNILSDVPISNADYTTNALDDDQTNNEVIPSNTKPLSNEELKKGTHEMNNEFDSAEKSSEKQESHDKLEINLVNIDEQTNRAEEETDEGPKKVKFSDINMDLAINDLEGFNKYSSDLTPGEIKQPISWKHSKEYIFSHYNVAPPNHHLLSFVDEIWPAESSTPLLKATESVIKSVTSLGNIAEIEEYSITSFDDNNSAVNNKRSDSTLVRFVNEEVDINNKEDLEMLQKCFDEGSTKSKRQDDIPVNEMSVNNDQKSDIYKNPNEMSQINRREMIYDCGDVNIINSDVSLQMELKDTKLENVSEIICYKSVTVRTSDKKVQTSFQTSLSYDQLKYDSNDIRKWCKGLENVTENLELWATWIENVCTNVIHLKYKEHRRQSASSTKWDKLINNINVDIYLWSQLSRRLYTGLKKYKRRFSSNPKSSKFHQQRNTYGCKCNKIFKKMAFG